MKPKISLKKGIACAANKMRNIHSQNRALADRLKQSRLDHKQKAEENIAKARFARRAARDALAINQNWLHEQLTIYANDMNCARRLHNQAARDKKTAKKEFWQGAKARAKSIAAKAAAKALIKAGKITRKRRKE